MSVLKGVLARLWQSGAAGSGRIRLYIYLLAFGLAVSCVEAAEEEDEPPNLAEDAVVLRRVVNTTYARQPQSELFKRAQESPARPVTVRVGETLSSIIAREFEVASTSAPDAYGAIEEAIVAQNQLPSADLIAAGQQLRVPDLPPATEPDATAVMKTRYPVCRSMLGQLTCRFAFRNVVIGIDPIVVQRSAVTQQEAGKLVASEGSGWEVESAPMEINFAAAQTQQISSILSDAEETRLRELMAQPVIRAVPLFILDDAWPDSQSFIESRAYLLDAIREVRQRFLMGASSLGPSFATMPFGPADEASGTATHARRIKEALAPFTSLDPGRTRVHSIYVPLFRLQRPAEDLLVELVSIHLMARDMGQRLGFEEVPDATRKEALKYARQYVRRISDKRERTISDQVIVQALAWFTRHWSAAAKRPFLLNLSWTVPNLSHSFPLPTDSIGLITVAAGNDARRVSQSRMQLAYRSYFPRDVLAVMNVDAAGAPACSSSLLDNDGDSSVVAFNGSLSGSECGTSFAAPRVAWLIAARAAGRQVDPSRNWARDTLRELGTLYDPARPEYNKIRFDVLRFFTQETNHAVD